MTDPNNRAQQLPPELRLHLECNFAAVRRGAAQIRNFLSSRGVNEKEIWACELAFVEGCNNAVQHTPGIFASEKIVVELVMPHGEIELRIFDYSAGCEIPAVAALPPPENERGRGIFLMRSLMDNVSYIRKDSTNCLVLKKSLTGI
jgi:serine/threonine-protein kinase RsbW